MLDLLRWTMGLMLAATFGCGVDLPARTQQQAASGPNALGWDPNSTAMGDCPNFAQASNGRLMTVVSRDHGRGAKAGALIELYYPNYAADNLWDSYVGVGLDGQTHWAQDLRLERQLMVPDTGIVRSEFGSLGVELVIEDAVDPASDVHLRHVTLTNRGSAPLNNAYLANYAFFTLNNLPGGDRLRFDTATHSLVQSDDGISVALAADPPPDGFHCGYANLPLGSARDARLAADGNNFDGHAQAGPATTGVNGAFRVGVPSLAPGASTTWTLAYGAGANEAAALTAAHRGLADGWNAVAGRDRARWSSWLGSSRMPVGVNATALAVYRRALVTMEQLTASNGAIIAGTTNTSPLYRFVWPRDGTLVALTQAQAGHPEVAKNFFAFAEHLQRADGGFAVNYFPDGSRPLWEFGRDGDEHDQVGLFAWGVAKTADLTHDAAWTAARWPAVRKACEFLLSVQQPDGLLGPCRDLWELDTGGSWTFSNAAAWAGLTAGARLARQAGDDGDAMRYEAAAHKISDAINTTLVTNGRFARGRRGDTLDGALEVANLALGDPWFGLVPESDPRLVATGASIMEKLAAPDGGIRRHEGDHYYGGQPWPVTTGWLALHQLALGDVSGAHSRFDVMTRWGNSTGAMMLGEQFDEGSGQWVSAFPLTWSEATYVRTALSLSGN